MNTKKTIILSAILAIAIGLMPLAAQNSPAGALVTGNIINRDIDIYMMPNFAPFVNYQRFFSFVQGSTSGTPFGWLPPTGTLRSTGPGFSAGYATNVRGTFMHFFLNTEGFALNNATTEVGMETTYERSRNLNLQFDTLIGTADMGAFKLGLLFNDMGQSTTESVTGRTTTRGGFFTPSIAYGINFINDDFSMVLAGGTVRFRIPMFENTVEQTTGGITEITTNRMRDTGPSHLQFPGAFPDTSMRLEIEPQMWWFFRPRLEPLVVISHIYLLNTFILQFFPEEIQTTQRTGVSNGFIRQERSFIGNTLFGYFNRLYVITPRFSVAWRVNFTFGFFRNFEGPTYTTAPGDTVAVSNEISREALYLAAVVSPRLVFSYQIIPATLTLNGGLILNPLGVVNSLGWQQYRITTTNNATDTVETRIENIFNPIQPFITMGAAWYLNPHIVLESGISINTTGGPGRHLDNISLAVVYRR